MKSKSLYEMMIEEFSDSDNRYCAYCLILEGNGCCDCGQRAWRTFTELDESNQKEIINQEFDTEYAKVNK
jgi:hypothetical protein